jgi:hypothetical protein
VRPLSDVVDGLVGHEARHAAVASLFEFNITNVRADWPEPDVIGRIEFDHAGEDWDRLRLAELFVTTAAGAMGEPNWPPAWPPSAHSLNTDEQTLACIAERLDLDQRKYSALTAVARKMVEHPAIRAAETAISDLLKRTNLGGRQARDVAEIAFDSALEKLRDEDQEREAQQDPRFQAIRDQAYLNTTAAMKDDAAKALRAMAARIAAEFGSR